MNLRRLMSLMLLVSTAPAALLSGYQGLVLHRQALLLRTMFLGQARAGARLLSAELQRPVKVFSNVTQLFDLPSLSRQECVGVLRMLYKQQPEITQLVLLNGENHPVVEPVFMEPEQPGTGFAGTRLPVGEKELERFLNSIPAERARKKRQAVGEPYVDERTNSVLVASAVALDVAGSDAAWVLGFEQNVLPLQQLLGAELAVDGQQAFVVDGAGRVVIHPDGRLMLKRQSMAGHPALAGHLHSKGPRWTQWNEGVGTVMAVAMPLGFADWTLVVQRKVPHLSPWCTAAGIVAILLAVFAVWFLSERRLLATMNRMKQLGIAAEKKAQQLRALQASLLESGKLSAIGDLGAGVAHEFNNPLGGIMGLVQLMLRKKPENDPDRKFLERIEQEAKRCKEITDNLLRFSEQQQITHREPLHLERVVDSALDLVRAKFTDKGIKVERRYEQAVARIVGHEGHLQRAVLNLLFNADAAMPEGGKLTISVSGGDGTVQLSIKDTGTG
ncbi:MAG: sensor histidine kinase, partial [Deltaproteobacteria bacterium]